MFKISKSVNNFYFHIPFCIKKCHFCAFPVHALGQLTDQSEKTKMYNHYVENLKKEIQFYLKPPSQLTTSIQSLYFGGGTPSLLSPSNFNSILRYFEKGINNNTQITLEMNPQQIQKTEQLLQQGINRISLGIQTLNKQTLSRFNRSYEYSKNPSSESVKQNLSSVLRRNKFSLNLDFILDFNSSSHQQNQLISLIDYIRPHHISLYMLEVNQGSYMYRFTEKFVDHFGKFQHYHLLCKQLSSMGYQHYEVSNFCLKGHQSKHNMAYWQGNKQFAGFGMGATSLLKNHRVTRPKNLSKYFKYIKWLQTDPNKAIENLEIHLQKNEQQQLKWVILSRIRQKEGIKWSQLCKLSSVDSKKIEKCKNQMNLISKQRADIIDGQWLEVGVRVGSENGYLFVDQIGYQMLESLNIQ